VTREVHGIGSGSCPVAEIGLSRIEPLVFCWVAEIVSVS
jgi:hypothetical protein